MNRELIGALAWGGGIVILALGASFARQQGIIDDDMVKRIVIGMNGIMIAWYGNRIPKAVLPHVVALRLARVAGWAFVLSGLIYAGLWAFAPIPVAIAGGCGAVIAGIVVTFGYGLWLWAKMKAA